MIITIASGKGGTGKTTVAVNLAYALSQAGKRVIDSKSYNRRREGIQGGEGIFRGRSRPEGLQGLSIVA